MIADTITPKLALGYPNVRRFLRQGREAEQPLSEYDRDPANF